MANSGQSGILTALNLPNSIQRSPLFFANISKKDPGRARQNSLATAGTNFTKPGAHNRGDHRTVFSEEKNSEEALPSQGQSDQEGFSPNHVSPF